MKCLCEVIYNTFLLEFWLLQVFFLSGEKVNKETEQNGAFVRDLAEIEEVKTVHYLFGTSTPPHLAVKFHNLVDGSQQIQVYVSICSLWVLDKMPISDQVHIDNYTENVLLKQIQMVHTSTMLTRMATY